MRAPWVSLAAAAVLVLEGIALFIVALVEIFGLGSGDATFLPTALALIALTLIGSAGLIAFAVAVRRGLSWGRSGGIVVQVLAIAVALSAASTVTPVPMPFVLGVGLSGLLGFVLLIATARRDGGIEREDDKEERASSEEDDAR